MKFLLQKLDQALRIFEEVTSKTLTSEQIARVAVIRSRIRIEVLISDDVDRAAVSQRISELTVGYYGFPWRLLLAADLQRTVDEEYERIGEL